MIKIFDYGMGNSSSIKNIIEYIGGSAEIVHNPEGLSGAKGIVLPGVGAFDNAMEKLEQLHSIPVLNKLIL